MTPEEHEARVEAKLRKAHLPDILGFFEELAYYPDTDLLALHTGVLEDVYLTINKENLVRFFVGFGALNRWLGEHQYDPVEDPSALSPGTAKILEGFYD